jgi:hypothetical protein
MYTVLSTEVYATEKSLSREIADQQRIDRENKEKEQQKQASQSAQQVAGKIPQWLTDWKAKLIQDFNTTHYNGNIVAVSGAQYNGIVGATVDRLKVKLPFGEAEVPWTLLSPKSLLALSASFARPDAPDLADRQWLCAVYAVETGQPEEAKRLATAAAQAKPEYQAQLQTLLQTKPPGR